MAPDKVEIVKKILLPTHDAYLKLVCMDDAPDFFKVAIESRDYFSKFDFFAPKFQLLQEAESAIVLLVQKQNSVSGAAYGLWQKENLLGLFKTNSIDWKELSANIGYWLTERSTGKGYAHTALNALIENCWNNLNLKSITAHTAVSNLKSHALLERLGFKRIKLIKDAVQIHGKSVDDFLYQVDRQKFLVLRAVLAAERTQGLIS